MKKKILSGYENASYIIKQKAFVFLWGCFIGFFLLATLLVLNIVSWTGMIGIAVATHPMVSIIIDLVLMATIFLCLIFLVKGNYTVAVNIMIVLLAVVSITGFLLKLESFIRHGTTSFTYLIYIVIATASMFGSRRALVAVSTFLLLSMSVSLSMGRAWYGFPLSVETVSSSINMFTSIILVSVLSYLGGEITDAALARTEQELEKNRRFSDELEGRVAQRTSELSLTHDRLHEAYRILELAHHKSERELELAQHVQKGLFTSSPPHTREWDTAFAMLPMAGVSGDFYDFYLENGELAGAALFDVSGHGIASGLITIMAKSLIFRKFTARDDWGGLAVLMTEINRDITEEIGSIENYLTGTILVFKEGSIELVNAGHPPMLCRDASTGTLSECPATITQGYNGIIGVADVATLFVPVTCPARRGDLFVLYTDGLIENRNSAGMDYGVPRLKEVIAASPQGTAGEMLEAVIKGYQSHIGNEQPQDDVTVMVLVKR